MPLARQNFLKEKDLKIFYFPMFPGTTNNFKEFSATIVQSTTITSHFTVRLLHVSGSTCPSSGMPPTEEKSSYIFC
jgi:hypothetical protein